MADIIDITPGDTPQQDQISDGLPPWFGFWFETSMNLADKEMDVVIYLWGSFDESGPFIIHQEIVPGSYSQEVVLKAMADHFVIAQSTAKESSDIVTPGNVIFFAEQDHVDQAEKYGLYKGFTLSSSEQSEELRDEMFTSLMSFMGQGDSDPHFLNLVPVPDVHGSMKQISKFYEYLHRLYTKHFFELPARAAFLVEDPEYPAMQIFPVINDGQIECISCSDAGFSLEEILDDENFDGLSEEETSAQLHAMLAEEEVLLLYIAMMKWEGIPEEVEVGVREYFEDCYKKWADEDVHPIFHHMGGLGGALDLEMFDRVRDAFKAIISYIDKRTKQGNWPTSFGDSLKIPVQSDGIKRSIKVSLLDL